VPDPVAGVEVRRSARRRRTVSAFREGELIVVQIPAHFSRADEALWVARMVERVTRTDTRAGRGSARSDDELLARCRALSTEFLPGAPHPASVRWVAAMRTRWASCTPLDRSIRVSRRLQTMPGWVLDYVLLHELSHLLVPGHGPNFWRLLESYPRTERARGYLDGVSAAAQLSIADDLETDLDLDTDLDTDLELDTEPAADGQAPAEPG
jgi:hypothetical protein